VPEEPDLDRTRLDLIAGGDAVLAAEFLAALIEEGQEVLDLIAAAVAADDRTTVSELAHRLRGMTAEIGAPRLHAGAAALEAAEDPERRSSALERARAALVDLRNLAEP
jgi:HPt (histidine-containing phosphotransfer) domain-containing protein